MTATIDMLRRAEAQLDTLTRGQEQTTIRQWRAACVHLADAPLDRPSDLRLWLRDAPPQTADEVLRSLIVLAQRGDAAALVATLVCLAPGIRALARRTGAPLSDALSEVTLGVLEYPVARRRSVAGGLLLDARNRLSRAARKVPQPVDLHTSQPGPDQAIIGSTATEPTAVERILSVLCEARRRDMLTHDDAQLIVDTRLGGKKVAPVAARLGISAAAAFQRRARAERRVAAVAGDVLLT